MKIFQHKNFYYENLITRKFPDLRYYVCMCMHAVLHMCVCEDRYIDSFKGFFHLG